MENVRQRQLVGRNHASELGEAASDPHLHNKAPGLAALRVITDRAGVTGRESVAMQSDGEGRARLLHQRLLN